MTGIATKWAINIHNCHKNGEKTVNHLQKEKNHLREDYSGWFTGSQGASINYVGSSRSHCGLLISIVSCLDGTLEKESKNA